MIRIMVARKKMKLTQEQLAEAIGVKRAIISKYENGTVEPSMSQISKIAEALNTSTAYLLEYIDDPTRHDLDIDVAKLFKKAEERRKKDEADPEKHKWSNNFKNYLKKYLDNDGDIGSFDREDLYRTANGYALSLDGYCQIADKLGFSLDKMVGLNAPSDENVKEFQKLFNQLTPEQQNLITAQIKGILSTKE